MTFEQNDEDRCVVKIPELIRIAEILVNLSQHDEAENLIHMCLKTNNLNIYAMMLLARLYVAKRRPDLAKRHCQVALMIAEQEGRHLSEISEITKLIETLELPQNKSLTQNKNTFKSAEIDREKIVFGQAQKLFQTENWQRYHQRIFDLFKRSIRLILGQDYKERDLSENQPILSVFERAELACLKFVNEARVFNFWPAHIIYCIEAAEPEGSYLEFGVSKGGTINTMADAFPEKIFYGFDSFLGLQEEWLGNQVGYLSLNGETPKVRENVILHVGYFEETLDQFLDENDEHIAFAHIDCDLYSSTKTIFSKIGHRLKKGSVLVFDEFIESRMERDEFQAFEEYIQDSSFSYKFLSSHVHGQSVAVKLE